MTTDQRNVVSFLFQQLVVDYQDHRVPVSLCTARALWTRAKKEATKRSHDGTKRDWAPVW